MPPSTPYDREVDLARWVAFGEVDVAGAVAVDLGEVGAELADAWAPALAGAARPRPRAAGRWRRRASMVVRVAGHRWSFRRMRCHSLHAEQGARRGSQPARRRVPGAGHHGRSRAGGPGQPAGRSTSRASFCGRHQAVALGQQLADLVPVGARRRAPCRPRAGSSPACRTAGRSRTSASSSSPDERKVDDVGGSAQPRARPKTERRRRVDVGQVGEGALPDAPPDADHASCSCVSGSAEADLGDARDQRG